MGLNMLGEKKIRFLRELTGLATIDRAATASHVESGRWWEFRVIEDGGDWHFRHWSSCAEIKGDAQ